MLANQLTVRVDLGVPSRNYGDAGQDLRVLGRIWRRQSGFKRAKSALKEPTRQWRVEHCAARKDCLLGPENVRETKRLPFRNQ